MVRCISVNRFLFGLILICTCIASFSVTAVAQSTTAEILGTVVDSSGGIVPGATVTVTNLGTAAVFTGVSDDAAGAFAIPLLPPGTYSIKAELSGFKTWVMPSVTLSVGDRYRVAPRMEVGELEQTVEVNGTAPTLQTEASNVATLISLQAVESLPLNGRNLINLARLAPGTSEGTQSPLGTLDDRRQSSSISINGLGANQNNFLLDGIDDNERFNGTVVVKPPIDAIQEMRVETSKYSAEFGRTAGGVINLITKSGTNNFHGSLFEFLRNEKMDARNFFATKGVTPKPAYKQNQFGGSIGGPIVKNKTFFFADYSGLRVRLGLTSTVSVPTTANRAGQFAQALYNPMTTRSNPAEPGKFIRDAYPAAGGVTDISTMMNPIARKVLDLWPQPNGGTASSPTYTQAATRPQRDDSWDSRIDHRFSDNDSIFGRFSFNDTTTTVPSQMPVVNGINPGTGTQAGTTEQRSQALGLNWVHSFSTSLLMELKGGYNRFSLISTHTNWGANASEKLGLVGVNLDQNSSGLATFTGFSPAAIGDAAFIPTICTNNIYQLVGSLSKLTAAHKLTTGGEFRIRQVAMHQSNSVTPTFRFDATATNNPATGTGGNAFATFLLGYPTATERNMYLVSPLYSVREVSGFVQDDWRANRWLTLNMGVRWDYYSPATERYNRIANVDLVSGNMMIAGQNGVSRSAGLVKDFNNFQPRVGFAATITKGTVLRGGTGLSYSPGSWNTPLALRNPPFVSLISESYISAQYSISPVPVRTLSTPLPGLIPTPTDRLLVTGNLAPVETNLRVPYTQQFNLALQRELPGNFYVTGAYVGQLTRKMITSLNVNQLNPGETVRPFASLFPKVGAGSITPSGNRLSNNYHSFQTLVERRFGDGLLLQGNYTYAKSIAMSAGQARGSLDRGRSSLDYRQRFTISGNYHLPIFKNSSPFIRSMLAGWQVNVVGIVRTGFYSTVTNLSPRTGTGAGITTTGGGGGVADRPNVVGDVNDGPRTVAEWFNTEAFVAQPLGSFGNAGAFIVENPGVKTVDFSLSKNFQIKEGTSLAFRFEAFNATNHPNFDAPTLQLGHARFGQLTSANNNLPRNLQVGMRLTF